MDGRIDVLYNYDGRKLGSQFGDNGAPRHEEGGTGADGKEAADTITTTTVHYNMGPTRGMMTGK